jgi:hemerythrin-like domain-containing protein
MDIRRIEAALEREHHEIDDGLQRFSVSLQNGAPDPAPLSNAIAALRRHIYIEEEFLFPAMQEDLAIPTLVMLREHGEIWRSLIEIEQRITSAEPDLAVLASCHELKVRLAAHNSKEEPIFYTRADSTLGADESEELMEFLENGELPNGWICRSALVDQ